MTNNPPGSQEAIAQGCKCPKDQPLAFKGQYWMHTWGPLHDWRTEVKKRLQELRNE